MDKFLVKTTPSKALSSVPADLESLDKPALIATIKRLRRERDELAATKTAPAAKKRKPSPPPVDAAAILKRLREKSIKAIKKTPHTEKRKPYTEVAEGCASKGTALLLLGDKRPKSDTKRMTRWVFEGDEGRFHAGCERLVHPVNFDGYSYCLKGETPRVYFWAAFESLDVKYEPSSNLLTLKFRTFGAGSGNPAVSPNLAAYSRGADVPLKQAMAADEEHQFGELVAGVKRRMEEREELGL